MGEAIDELPPRLREPIRLHYYQEKCCREIAELLGISSDNVRKRMSQARAILKEKLSEFAGEEDGFLPEPRKRGKSKKGTVAAPAVGESLQGVLPVGSGEPVGAVASEQACADKELGIVAGGQLRGEPGTPTPSPPALRGSLRGFGSRGKSFNYPSTVQRLEDWALGIVAGGFWREAGLFAVPVVLACGEVAKGELGIAAGGEPLLEGVDTGRIMKILCTVLGTPLSHLKAGCGTGGRRGGTPVLGPEMGTGVRTSGTDVLRREMGTGVRTSGTDVLGQDVGASVWDGHLGHKEPEAGVREMRWLFGLCWRVWADSGGCWLSSLIDHRSSSRFQPSEVQILDPPLAPP